LLDIYWNILTMHGPINVKSPNNISKWQMGFNSAFKGLISTGVWRREPFSGTCLLRSHGTRDYVEVIKAVPTKRCGISYLPNYTESETILVRVRVLIEPMTKSVHGSDFFWGVLGLTLFGPIGTQQWRITNVYCCLNAVQNHQFSVQFVATANFVLKLTVLLPEW
jgi:hypothetical protein